MFVFLLTLSESTFTSEYGNEQHMIVIFVRIVKCSSHLEEKGHQKNIPFAV